VRRRDHPLDSPPRLAIVPSPSPNRPGRRRAATDHIGLSAALFARGLAILLFEGLGHGVHELTVIS
jgi:hypothetical protein